MKVSLKHDAPAMAVAFALSMFGTAVVANALAHGDAGDAPKPAPTVTHTVYVPAPAPVKTIPAKPKPAPPKPRPAPKTPRQMGKKAAAERGWTGAEWEALDGLWRRESDWNPNAQNPTSTAYGIPQFLDDTWPSYGIAKTSDAGRQIEAGLRYIERRYGKPSKALAFWLRHNWY